MTLWNLPPLIIVCSHLAHLFGPSSKNKKKSTPKKFLIFREIELSCSNIKKFLIFSFISGNGNPKKLLTPQETETPKKIFIFPRKKACLIFPETKTQKKSLYFKKRNFLIFQETELSYISGKVYSEP